MGETKDTGRLNPRFKPDVHSFDMGGVALDQGFGIQTRLPRSHLASPCPWSFQLCRKSTCRRWDLPVKRLPAGRTAGMAQRNLSDVTHLSPARWAASRKQTGVGRTDSLSDKVEKLSLSQNSPYSFGFWTEVRSKNFLMSSKRDLGRRILPFLRQIQSSPTVGAYRGIIKSALETAAPPS